MGLRLVGVGPQYRICFFADDSLLFCQAKEDECRNLLQILQWYGDVSGQRVNFHKSALIFGKGIEAGRKGAIKSLTGIQKTGGFGRYLGLPEMVGRSKTDAFSFIRQRVMKRLDSWYFKLLSLAGKEVLIKAVATALPTYCMSCFLLPIGIANQITSAIR